MLVALIMMLIIVAISMLLPRLFRLIIDVYIPQKDFSGLVASCLVLLTAYLLRFGAFVLRNNRMLHFGYYYIYDLRNILMHHFQRLSFRYYDCRRNSCILHLPGFYVPTHYSFKQYSGSHFDRYKFDQTNLRCFGYAAKPAGSYNPVIPKTGVKGRIAFENVTFQYENSVDTAISNISFEVSPGKKIALVGASGAGKSTMLNLITRFYDPTNGRILLDGVDLRYYELQWLRRNISLVLQEGFLFWGMVRENIRYGRIGAGDREVEHAAKLAYAHDFIMGMPKGYDTSLGERGVWLSGGQRQRIAIARAILKNAPVLSLDEATSALDNESEYKIQQAMKEVTANRTTFIIAHRLSAIRHVDEIFVMDKGQIIEHGSHEELIARGAYYHKLHQIHLPT